MSFFPTLLVIFQFTCIAFLAFTQGAWAYSFSWQVIELISLLLGVWAISVIPLPYLSIFPKPKQGAILVTNGPYKLIRHPMYTAVLGFCLALVMNEVNLSTCLVYGFLMIVLLVKLHYEEKLMRIEFPDYRAYQQKSYKLIPFIF